ncbi:hypothetical protein THAOC_21774, partial [Thalassiosira oceanica]
NDGARPNPIRAAVPARARGARQRRQDGPPRHGGAAHAWLTEKPQLGGQGPTARHPAGASV